MSGKSWKVSVITYASPFGAMATHGSVARVNAPPEQMDSVRLHPDPPPPSGRRGR
jgi:hypothetical protein